MAFSPALASGFSLAEQGAKASALGGAWVAGADDPAACWYNPAALVRLKGTQIQAGAGLPWLSGHPDFSSGDPAWGLDSSAPTSFRGEHGSLAAVQLYAAGPIGRRFAWGIGLNRPFGLATKWDERPVTFSSETFELGTYRANANVAWAINETWSIAAGLAYLRANLDTSREVPVNLDGDPNTIEALGRSDLSSRGNDLGFNFAALYATGGFSAALVYRSGVTPTLDGDLSFSGFGAAQPLFPNTPVQVDMELPAELVGGVSWGAADTWQFELDVAWTQWSSFEALRVDALSETPPFVVDERLRQDWDDVIGYHLGVSWDFAEGHEARVGLLQEPTAVPDDTRRPGIVDSDRIGLSVGYGFSGQRFSVDAYAASSFFTDATASGDPGEGVLDGRYQTRALSLGGSVTCRF